MGSQPLLGQIMMVSFGYAPKGWALCNGQLLPINQNQALFSLLGTFYGGNGQTTFALPNLQGRVPLHMGTGYNLGQLGGEEAHTLVVGEIPAHQHGVIASSASANVASPIGAFLANSGNTNFASVDANLAVTPLNASAVAVDGGGQPHENRAPYLAINFVIALQGVYPSRS
jgi:microcystin-dependent protein